MVAGHCWPGNRNDDVVARATVAQMLTGHHEILATAATAASTPSPHRDATTPAGPSAMTTAGYTAA
jgi:hypothetical protein